MPATNFTQKLKLGIYQGNDSISPLVTGNENMEKIDAFAQGVDNQFAITQNQVNTNTTNIQTNAEEISDLDGRVKVIEGKVPDYDANLVTVAGLAGEVDTLQTDMATAKTDIVNVTQEANTNTTNITAINTKLAEELPFPLAIDTESGATKYGWKTTTTGTFTPFAPVPPFNLATQGEGEDKQYGYTNDAGEFVPFDINKLDKCCAVGWQLWSSTPPLIYVWKNGVVILYALLANTEVYAGATVKINGGENVREPFFTTTVDNTDSGAPKSYIAMFNVEEGDTIQFANIVSVQNLGASACAIMPGVEYGLQIYSKEELN